MWDRQQHCTNCTIQRAHIVIKHIKKIEIILFLLYFIRIFKLCCFTCDNISLGTRKQKHGNFRTAQIFNIDQYPVFNVDSFFLHLYSRTLISIYILNVGHSSFLTSIKTKQKKQFTSLSRLPHLLICTQCMQLQSISIRLYLHLQHSARQAAVDWSPCQIGMELQRGQTFSTRSRKAVIILSVLRS